MTRALADGPGIVTLTSDFGTRDHYVGAMKGAIALVAPTVRVVDITHEIPSFDIAEGAFAIAQAYAFFPAGSVHVVVVDPGVGTARRPLAVAAARHVFVGPDNGVFAQVLAGERFEARRIDSRHGLAAVSRTFHGRDLFAPAAARLADGLPFAAVGPPCSDLQLPPSAAGAAGMGRALHVDRYGNVVTSFRAADLAASEGLAVGEREIRRRASAYATAPAGEPFLIVGSSGYVEISVNRGSAATVLGIQAGAEVRLAGEGAERAPNQVQSANIRS